VGRRPPLGIGIAIGIVVEPRLASNGSIPIAIPIAIARIADDLPLGSPHA